MHPFSFQVFSLIPQLITCADSTPLTHDASRVRADESAATAATGTHDNDSQSVLNLRLLKLCVVFVCFFFLLVDAQMDV